MFSWQEFPPLRARLVIATRTARRRWNTPEAAHEKRQAQRSGSASARDCSEAGNSYLLTGRGNVQACPRRVFFVTVFVFVDLKSNSRHTRRGDYSPAECLATVSWNGFANIMCILILPFGFTLPWRRQCQVNICFNRFVTSAISFSERAKALHDWPEQLVFASPRK